jgi:hypothetical protein
MGVDFEFASAVNAAQCAIELQKRMAAANEALSEDQRISHWADRHHLGDVGSREAIQARGHIAARLQGLRRAWRHLDERCMMRSDTSCRWRLPTWGIKRSKHRNADPYHRVAGEGRKMSLLATNQTPRPTNPRSPSSHSPT